MDSSETSYSSPLPVAVATTPTMSLTLSQTGYADTNWHEVEARLQNATSLAERTRTYGGRWPRESPLDPVELARAGFIYVGPGVAVQCVLCGLKIEKWLPGDSALGAHLASKPQCLFVADVYRSDSNKAGEDLGVQSGGDKGDDRASFDGLTGELAAKNAQLKSDLQCRVCRECMCEIVSLPCGHFATCEGCAKIDKCPICGQPVKATVRVFMG